MLCAVIETLEETREPDGSLRCIKSYKDAPCIALRGVIQDGTSIQSTLEYLRIFSKVSPKFHCMYFKMWSMSHGTI